MNSVKKFLYWNSGAPKHLIENCPKKEQHNYLKLGLIALIPTVFAFVSGFYAFYTIIVKDNDISVVDFIVIAILASIWACAIYFIDIYIIATYRKLKKVRFQILPRIFLSLVLGLVISHPIVLKILEDPIEFKTIDIKNSQINSLDSLRINELNLKVNNEINNFNNKLEKIDSTRLSLTTEFVKEIQGKGSKKADGSPNPNRGNIANDIEIKEQKYYDEADALNEGFSKRKNYLLDTIQKQINSKWDSIIDETRSRPYFDIYAKTLALDQIMEDEKEKKKHTTLIFYLAILTAFMLLDATAFLLKLMTPVGPLEYLLEQEDIKYKIEYEEFKNTYEDEYKIHYSQFLIKKIGIEAQVKMSKEILERTHSQVEFVTKERRNFLESLKELINERESINDSKRIKEIDKIIDSLNDTFLNSIQKSNKLFNDIINRE